VSTFVEFQSWLVVEVAAAGFGAATLAGKLFADLGCTVARLELQIDPTSDETDTARELFELVSRGKHSVSIASAHSAAVGALDALLGSAEILVTDRQGLLSLQEILNTPDLRDRFGRLTVCACTPFGIQGPMSAWTGGEEIVQAVSGIMSITGHPGSGPTRVAGAPLTHAAAMFAVTSSLADVMRKGSGAKPGALDITVYDAAIAFESASLPAYFLTGVAPHPIGNRHSMSVPWNSFRCADGWVIICAGNHPNWVRLCEMIGRPELVTEPRYRTQEDRIACVDEIEAEITAWTRDRRVDEVEALLNRGTIAGGSVLPLHDVVEHAQFRERNLVDGWSGGRQAGGVFHLNREPLAIREGAWRTGAGTRAILVERCHVPLIQYDGWRACGAVVEEQVEAHVESA
jgi:CoA:oxalate CoA-transferase